MKFSEIVGQAQAKQELAMRLEAFKAGQAMPSILYVAPRGKGKTSLATATGLAMRDLTDGNKRFYELNSASVKNLKQFWNSIMIPIVNDRDVTILLDEAHELPSGVTNCLLTCLNPNPEGRNSYTYEDMTIDIDMKRQTFLFATTEVHKMFHALVNRCRRIDLEEYTTEEMATILKRSAKKITFEKGVDTEVASCLRATPRQAVMIAQDIATYLAPQKRTSFKLDDWNKLRTTMGILPMGLTRIELRVLQVLESHPDASLTRVAATLQMTPDMVRRDSELFLLRQGLIQIDTTGRNLTPAGRQYLKDLANTTKK